MPFPSPHLQAPDPQPTDSIAASTPCDRRHFIVATGGTRGDLHPFLGVAQSLQSRDHRVSFLGSALYEDLIRASGLAFQAIGSPAEHIALIDDPALWDERRGVALVMGAVAANLRVLADAIRELSADAPAVLLAHPLALPAAALARATRPHLRVVGAYLAPPNLRALTDPMWLGSRRLPSWVPRRLRAWLWQSIDRRFIDPAVLPALNAERRAAQLAPVAHFMPHLYTVPDLSVTFFPDWFAPRPPDWPTPLVTGDFPLFDPAADRPLPPALQDFLAAGAPPIVVTPGTGHKHAAALFRHALQAVTAFGRRALFLTPYREQVPADLPPDVMWHDYAPFRPLLPRIAALVHHGGIGTTAEALRAGVPQLVLPLAFDQFGNAGRVVALGVGASLRAERVTAARLAAALRRVLDPETGVREACRAVAARFDAGAPRIAALCESIEAALDRQAGRGTGRSEAIGTFAPAAPTAATR